MQLIMYTYTLLWPCMAEMCHEFTWENGLTGDSTNNWSCIDEWLHAHGHSDQLMQQDAQIQFSGW